MQVIANYHSFQDQIFVVHADGGHGRLEHVDPQGTITLIYEGETVEALVEFADLVTADVAPGYLCECGKDDCTAPDCEAYEDDKSK